MAAPLALFVYKRAAHTARTIAALKACDGFADTAVTVFADGAKSVADEPAVAAVRALVAAELPGAQLVAAPANQGLARSIIAGTTALVRQHGRVIVLEDDLLVAPDFLTFMNAALDRYADDARVMQVSGHMFDVDVGPHPVFLPFVTSWGWGTWARAWDHFDPDANGAEALDTDSALRRRFDLDGSYDYYGMLKRQQRGQVDSWAIRWNWSVFRRGGLVLYPPHSLIENDGFDAEATHTRRPVRRTAPRSLAAAAAAVPDVGRIGPVAVDEIAFARIKRLLRRQQGPLRRVARAIIAATARA